VCARAHKGSGGKWDGGARLCEPVAVAEEGVDRGSSRGRGRVMGYGYAGW